MVAVQVGYQDDIHPHGVKALMVVGNAVRSFVEPVGAGDKPETLYRLDARIRTQGEGATPQFCLMFVKEENLYLFPRKNVRPPKTPLQGQALPFPTIGISSPKITCWKKGGENFNCDEDGTMNIAACCVIAHKKG